MIGHVVADGIVGVIEPSMRLSLVLLALVAGLSSGASFAQEEPDAATVPLDRFRSTIDDKGLGTTEGGAIPGHLGFQGGLILNYALNPLVLRDPDGVVIAPIVAHRLVGDALFTIGLFDYVSIGVDLPMTLVQVGGAVPDNVADAVGFASGLSVIGLGDLRLVPKVRLLREDAHGVSLSVIPTITLPTAGGIRFNDDGPSYEYGGDYLGEGPGAFAFIPEVAISTNIFGLRPAANLAYRLRQPTRLLGEFAIHPELVYRLGVGYDVGASVKDLAGLLVFAEIFGATADRNPFGLIDDSNPAEVRLQNPMEALAGARYNVGGGFIIEGGIGTGLRAGFGSPDLRVFAGVRRVFENRDRDGDGIDDDKDTCPDDPEDKDGFDDQDGCPDLDNDGDGFADKKDRCPNEAGPKENQGCPDTDRDGDGVVDRLDNCPDEAGPADNAGCVKKQLVRLQAEKIEILDKVFFKTGQDVIENKSFPLLDNVAEVLNKHPEIAHIRVEGHTDNTGSDATNRDLSDRRAKAVVKYLTNKGVAADRVVGQGYGPERPVADNGTDEGRAANRRVEFVIVHDDEAAAGDAAAPPAAP